MNLPRLRLLFVIDSFGSGGAQAQMTDLAVALAKRGHVVEFFLYYPQYRHWASRVEEAGILVHEEIKVRRFSPRVLVALHRLIGQGRYDAVLAFLETPSFYAELSKLIRPATVLVVSERSSSQNGRGSLRRRIMRQFHRTADYVVANSHHHSRELAARHPWIEAKLGVILNGVRIEEFVPRRADHSGFGSARLLAVGSIVSYKNVLGLIRALAECRYKYGDDVTISWAGKRVPGKDGERTHKAAAELAAELGVADCWSWLGERTDIAALLSENEALIHPSFFEGTANAICEALASGRPVLAGDIADHRELIQSRGAGYLFDPQDHSTIAATIHQFAALPFEDREAMGRRARRVAEQLLSLERFVDEYESLLGSLVACRGGVRETDRRQRGGRSVPNRLSNN